MGYGSFRTGQFYCPDIHLAAFAGRLSGVSSESYAPVGGIGPADDSNGPVEPTRDALFLLDIFSAWRYRSLGQPEPREHTHGYASGGILWEAVQQRRAATDLRGGQALRRIESHGA